jgi:4-methylaminobutanoate oxidase (formaldehyde-forming)
LGTLHQDGGVSRQWIADGGFEVQIAGSFHPVNLGLRGFYDPTGERMRG